MDYYVVIRGTTYTEFLDGEEYDGVYDIDADEDDMLAVMGDIVDHTDTSQAAGVLYIKVLDSYMYTPGKYIAVAWKELSSGSSVRFMTHQNDYATLGEVKAALNNASNNSQFDDDGFYDYEVE
jgi:hypothetical protein